MDIIILDYDGESFSRKLPINSGDATVVLIDDTYTLDISNYNRAIFISRANQGFKAYHIMLFNRLSRIKHWIIDLVDVAVTLRNQAVSACNNYFDTANAFHEFVFDNMDLDGLRKTIEKPIKNQRVFCVLGQSKTLVKSIACLMAKDLEEWKIYTGGEARKYLSQADAVLTVGNTATECKVVPPLTYITNQYAWINQQFCLMPDKHRMLQNQIYEFLSQEGWNLQDETHVLLSSFGNEETRVRLKKHEVTAKSLINNDCFVLWDEYGLPATEEYYTDERIAKFLADNCRLTLLISNVNRGNEK